jgi:hypothetical protein
MQLASWWQREAVALKAKLCQVLSGYSDPAAGNVQKIVRACFGNLVLDLKYESVRVNERGPGMLLST